MAPDVTWDEGFDSPEAWVCGTCNVATTETHYWTDERGVMCHEADPAQRRLLRGRVAEVQTEQMRDRIRAAQHARSPE